MHWKLLLGLCLAAAPGSGLPGQPAEDPAIRAAVRRGVQYLKSTQQPDGSWRYSGHELGITSLVALALVENGVKPDDPSLAKALEFVRSNASSNTMTYDISLAVLLLARVGRAEDRELVLSLGERLAAGQLKSGGWTYFCPLVVPRSAADGSVTNRADRKGRPAARRGPLNFLEMAQAGLGDNSNTQFAVLGIWAAGRAGLDVKNTMAAVDRRFRTTQTAAGGWPYNSGDDTDAMTCAGLMSLALAKGYEVLEGSMSNRAPGDASAKPAARTKLPSDPNIERGIKRTEHYAARMSQNSTLYFLWSVERVAVALGLERIGNVDWYRRGSALLLKNQSPDGSWRSNRGELADTSFALLFLKRSNLADGMPQLVGRRSGTESSENQVRAGSLDELRRSVRTPANPDP